MAYELEAAKRRWMDAFFAHARRKRAASDHYNRELVITPFEGNYGPAGFVIAINGSPPKGILVVQVSGGGAWRAEFMHQIVADQVSKLKFHVYGEDTQRQTAAILWEATIDLLSAQEFLSADNTMP